MLHDSFWIDWVWADQFAAELAKGTIYPRWLPEMHGGLGAPTFYFYPPLAFYLSAAFGIIFGLSTYASVIAAFTAALIGSGYAIHAWLSGRARYPLLGALLYMAAPYHLYDFYGRGAQAESLAIAFIPIVALGIRDSRFGLLALSYAGLILAHLPLALLVSLFLIAPYSLYLYRGRSLLPIAGGLLVGLALSSTYLVPALALQPYRDAGLLWADAALQPENWSLWSWSVPGPKQGMRNITLAIMVSLIPAILLLRRRLACCAALGLAIVAGLVPGLWTLPLIEKVQFPFRLLPVIEFVIATGLALRPPRPIWAMVAIPALTLSVVFVTAPTRRSQVTIAELAATHPGVPEHLPPGDRPYSWPSQWALEMAEANPGATFVFPSWEIDCVPRDKLIPADCDKRLSFTWAELVGLLLSMGALILLMLVRLDRSSYGFAAVRPAIARTRAG